MSSAPVAWCLVALLVAGCTSPSPGGADETPNAPLPGDGFERSPALPGEREEESADELDRPGEYVLLEPRLPRSDVVWAAPAWENGSWWRYQHELSGAPACEPLTEDEVYGRDVRFGAEVVLVRTVEHDCRGEAAGEKERAFLAAELTEMDDDGYVEPKHLFPFEDGKRWRYLRAGGVLVDAELTHVPSYPRNGSAVEAWRLDLTFSGENVTIQEWLGVEAQNILRQEIWAEDAGGLVYALELAAHAD